MKKRIAFLMLVFTAVSVYAAEDWKYNRRMAVVTNPMPFFIGTAIGGFGASIGFEYSLKPQFSTEANLYYMGFKQDGFYYGEGDAHTLNLRLESRWYPHENNLHGLFVNGGLQYLGAYGLTERYYDWINDEYTRESEDLNTAGFYFGLGYKLIFGKNRHGLVIEPLLEYIYSVRLSSTDPLDSAFGYFGLIPVLGFRFNLNFGVAF